MTDATLDALIEREDALIAALDAGDIDRIETETRTMAGAIAAAAARNDWRERGDLRERVIHALRLTEAAGGRINYLADDNRRRFERLVTLAGRPQAEAYGRSGRMA